MEQFQDDILLITSLQVRMELMVIYQPRIEAPMNHNTYRSRTAHAVASILGEVAFFPLSHDTTMTLGNTSGRLHKYETYGDQYVEFIP